MQLHDATIASALGANRHVLRPARFASYMAASARHSASSASALFPASVESIALVASTTPARLTWVYGRIKRKLKRGNARTAPIAPALRARHFPYAGIAI
ncbi:hypothetical protein ACLFKT_12580, partial [Paraburkholderia sp. BR14261]